MDGWSRWSFLLGFGQFSGANVLLVSGRETNQLLHLYFFETTEGMTWNGWASPFLDMNTEEYAASQVPWVTILQRRVWTWPIDSLVWVTLVFQLKTPPRSSTKNRTDPRRALSKLLTWEWFLGCFWMDYLAATTTTTTTTTTNRVISWPLYVPFTISRTRGNTMIYQLHAKLLVHRPIHAFDVHQDWRLCGMLRPALGKGTSNPTHPGIFWDNDGDV